MRWAPPDECTCLSVCVHHARGSTDEIPRGARATRCACARSRDVPAGGRGGGRVSSGVRLQTYRREYGRVCGMCAIIAAYNRQFAILFTFSKKEPPPRAARIRARAGRGEHRTGAALRLEPLDYSDLSVVPRAVGARGLHPTRGAGREYGGPALYSLGVLYVFGSGFINNYFRDSHDGGVGILCRARRFVTDLLSSSGRRLRTDSMANKFYPAGIPSPGPHYVCSAL